VLLLFCVAKRSVWTSFPVLLHVVRTALVWFNKVWGAAGAAAGSRPSAAVEGRAASIIK
jgi:hypothetical protein